MATLKQKKLAKEIVENGGSSIAKSMIAVGYSRESARNPQHVTKSKGWKELLDQYIPDDFVLETLQRILNYPDTEKSLMAKVKALDIAYKLRGRYAPTTIKLESPNDSLTDQELQEKIQSLRSALLQRLNEVRTENKVIQGETVDEAKKDDNVA